MLGEFTFENTFRRSFFKKGELYSGGEKNSQAP